MSTRPGPKRLLDPTVVVLVALVSSFAWVLVFPVRLTNPPAGALGVGYLVTLAVFAVLLAAVLRAAVTPAASARPVILVGALLAVSLGLWTPTYLWAQPAQEPWAWMAGFVVGACAVASSRLGVLAALVLGAAALLGAIMFGGSVLANLGVAFGAGLVCWLAGWILVWLLRLVRAAEAGQQAEAQMATAHERLRMSRVLHDVLGHRLGIIALKAELAADLAASDPVRAARESNEVRELAAATLTEARQAVQGESPADVQTQLASAELVLASAVRPAHVMSRDATIRVLRAEDEELIRTALVALLERESDITVVATASDGHEARDRALAHRPDVAIVDLQMPGRDGISVVTELARLLPSCAGIILTGHGRPHLLRQALSSGARGFLAKGAPGTALAEVVRRVHSGQRYVDPILAADALTEEPSPLTAREAEVLAAAGEDRPVRDISRALVLSPGTVGNYLAALTRKLEAGSRAEAYRIARDRGWL